MPPKCQMTSAATAPELVAARGGGVRAEDVVPAPGEREAHKRDGADARGAGQEEHLPSRRLERPREAALESDRHEQRRDQSHQPNVRRQREHDRGADEKLPYW